MTRGLCLMATTLSADAVAILGCSPDEAQQPLSTIPGLRGTRTSCAAESGDAKGATGRLLNCCCERSAATSRVHAGRQGYGDWCCAPRNDKQAMLYRPGSTGGNNCRLEVRCLPPSRIHKPGVNFHKPRHGLIRPESAYIPGFAALSVHTRLLACALLKRR
jgi:hypothetical protein